MKHKLTSLRVRMLLPVIVMTLFVVILLTVLFSRAYISMILQQENEVNAVGFDTVSRTITPLINNAINEVRSIMSDDRVAGYARGQFVSVEKMIRCIPVYSALRKILTAAMKLSGGVIAVQVFSLTRSPGCRSMEAWLSWILPYSCSTPLGLPVLPEVYMAKQASWGSACRKPRLGSVRRISSQTSLSSVSRHPQSVRMESIRSGA